MTAEDIIQEVLLRLADIIIHGGNTPQKLVVSEKVYDCLMDIKLFPKCMEMIDGVCYIADLPVEMGYLNTDKKAEIWFQIQ